jgi:hypothetical protein
MFQFSADLAIMRLAVQGDSPPSREQQRTRLVESITGGPEMSRSSSP